MNNISSENSEVLLETKLVGDIEGHFAIPSYQRGYRWGKSEVIRLLDDIYSTEGKRNYCLQPVVVRKNGKKYEVIDGQQRLTTIYLIYRYMNQTSNGFISKPKFTISYDIRNKSEEFLKSIDESRKEEYIDFWFIYSAYESIKNWFEAKGNRLTSAITNFNKYFDERIKIIWYEVGVSADAIELFTRLNIGKIPLTSAELVKAMFLSNAQMDKEKQEEISLQWDNIEKELHHDALWYFLTNNSGIRYQTRIDLVLDLISEKTDNSRDKYYTFFKFDEMRQTQNLEDIWRKIQQTFLVLKDWFENHELYHKIGYLIAISGKMSLLKIFNLSANKTKEEFRKLLDSHIRESINIAGNYSELSYEKQLDQAKISRLLLLFNVESVRQHGEHSQWFPFDKFKFDKNGKVTWSLEHIHAQQSEGMRTQEAWKKWIELHIPSVQSVDSRKTELIESMKVAIEKEKLEGTEFLTIQQQVIKVLSVEGNTEYLHSISNLALLDTRDNAALSNATFDVKRNEIIKMDRNGHFIPFCTRMAFLKYYTPSEKNQLHFWGYADRIAYVQEINRVLKSYLNEPIVLEKEEK